MPETFKVTVWGDAQAEATNTSRAKTAASRVLIFFITPPWSRFSKRTWPRTDTQAQRERALKLSRIWFCRRGESWALRTLHPAGRPVLAGKFVGLPTKEPLASQRLKTGDNVR